jgi:REP element-mobilizing transposase RayT
MNRNTGKHNRRLTRLKNFDYQQPGVYYVTLVVKDREHLFGEICQGKIHLSPYGKIAEQTWLSLPKTFPQVTNEIFVIMPNHIHGLITFTDTVSGGLPEVIRYFKSFSARKINHLRDGVGIPVWQRNYYEHIVRNDEELNKIRQYIQENPHRWELSMMDEIIRRES